MTAIRPARLEDAPRIAELLTQLGYPGELEAVAGRLALLLRSPTHLVLVDTRVDGCVSAERRLVLHQDEHVEITGLVVDAAVRRSGLGRALVRAAEQWAVRHGVPAVVVRSNVVRPESHAFYEAAGYRRTATSHSYRRTV